MFVTVFSESESVLNETSLLSYFGQCIRKWSFPLKETFKIHSKIQRNVKFLYFNVFVTVFSESESVLNETSLLSYFGRCIRKWRFFLKETFKIHSKIQRIVKFFYFNLFVTVFSVSESVLNETSLLSYFGQCIRKWSFSLKETFKIHFKIQSNVKFLYFNLFVTVFSESESVLNETSLLSYIGRYKMKWSFSLKETFKIPSKIQRDVKFLYFKLFVTVFNESESVLNETSLLSYLRRCIRKWSFSL